MGSGPVVGPRGGVQAVADGRPHQFVIRRVVLDLVDPVAVAVMGVQDRHVAVGQVAPALRGGTAGQRAEFGDLVHTPSPALADEGLHQHRRGRGIVVEQRGYLVGHDVRIRHSLNRYTFSAIAQDM